MRSLEQNLGREAGRNLSPWSEHVGHGPWPWLLHRNKENHTRIRKPADAQMDMDIIRRKTYTWWGWLAPSNISPGTRNKARCTSGVRKGDAKSMAAGQRRCNRRESKGEGDLTMAAAGELGGSSRRCWDAPAEGAGAKVRERSGGGRSARNCVHATMQANYWAKTLAASLWADPLELGPRSSEEKEPIYFFLI
jgi:hypothetical protein